VASTNERNRVQAFSLNSFLLWGLGPVGAFLSGQVVEVAAGLMHVSASNSSALRVGMVFMAALALAGAVPYLFLREPHRSRQNTVGAPTPRAVAPLFARLLIPDVILAFGVGSILTFIQLYFHLRFHLNAGPIGVIVAVGGVIAGIGTLSVPIVARRWGNLRTTVTLQWMAVPLMVAVAIATNLVIATVAFWLVITLRGMIDPVYTAFIQERVPESYRARLTGMYSVTYSIGYALGPAASGQLQKMGGFTPAFLMAALCYLVGGTLLYLFFSRPRSQSADAAVPASAE
jgi:predicted MFS family arabinose efflux permease